MRIVVTLAAAAVAAATMVLTAPAASGDTGACVSYLEDIGKDTTVRVQICAETETLGDTVSQAYALSVCNPLMQLTGLSQHESATACQLAVQP